MPDFGPKNVLSEVFRFRYIPMTRNFSLLKYSNFEAVQTMSQYSIKKFYLCSHETIIIRRFELF